MSDQTNNNIIHLVLLRLRELGKPTYFILKNNINVRPGNIVIVEQDKGLDYGMIIGDVEDVDKKQIKEHLHKIERIATPEDHAQIKKNKQKISDVFNVCIRKVEESGLDMKLIEGEYSFDRTKIILYFSAEGRVDFRNLVKDLAHIFRVRIELKQIGVRDEAKLLGGCGPCGRILCCVSYLKDFKPVTIRMAKDQNLSLNPAKISGVCGRLMCCLEYEHNFYRCRCKGMPKIGDTIKYEGEKARVISINAFKRSVTVQTEEGKFKVVEYGPEPSCPKQKMTKPHYSENKNQKDDEIEDDNQED